MLGNIDKTVPMCRMAAIVYEDGPSFDAFVCDLAKSLRDTGRALAGVVQINQARQNSRHCDMVLEDLATGQTVQISEDRGAEASGCRLNVGALLEAGMTIRHSLSDKTDLLLINKFGKMESEGGGLRDVIVEASFHDIPVLIGVPERNKAAWQAFCGNDSNELQPVASDVSAWLERAFALYRGTQSGC